MPLIDPTRILNNLTALAVIFGIGFLIYSKLDKESVKSTIEGIKGLFSKKEE